MDYHISIARLEPGIHRYHIYHSIMNFLWELIMRHLSCIQLEVYIQNPLGMHSILPGLVQPNSAFPGYYLNQIHPTSLMDATKTIRRHVFINSSFSSCPVQELACHPSWPFLHLDPRGYHQIRLQPTRLHSL